MKIEKEKYTKKQLNSAFKADMPFQEEMARIAKDTFEKQEHNELIKQLKKVVE